MAVKNPADVSEEIEAGTIPVEWSIEPLESFAHPRGGYAFNNKYQGNTNGPTPFFKVSDMNLPENTREMKTANNYVDHEVVKKIRLIGNPGGVPIYGDEVE